MYRHVPNCLERPRYHNRLRRLFNTTSETDPPLQTEEIRHELVERVRQEIAAGNYDTPEKWQVALDRLAEDLT
jgi:hypothetical protein